jgi:hypothetical protein
MKRLKRRESYFIKGETKSETQNWKPTEQNKAKYQVLWQWLRVRKKFQSILF